MISIYAPYPLFALSFAVLMRNVFAVARHRALYLKHCHVQIERIRWAIAAFIATVLLLICLFPKYSLSGLLLLGFCIWFTRTLGTRIGNDARVKRKKKQEAIDQAWEDMLPD